MPRESRKARLDRMHEEYALLCAEFPNVVCALHFDTPFQLLVATILSAQTTDRRVNTVTPGLFRRWPTPESLAHASPEDVEDVIHPLGFFHAKTRNLLAMAAKLVADFDGVVPPDMDSLTSLPGVGRKTANVVLGNAFAIPGFPVDTHVIRVTRRLRWRTARPGATPDPVAIEREITAGFPPEEWTDLSHRLILLGRGYCHARVPDCASCPLRDSCPSAGSYLRSRKSGNRAARG
ncbi:endonuclease III [uncultured Bifidobacterium sp.]|uniref:endonuclease III n=1 Tax=uncultured Bifidobacterium sp. TaxID=165187 RepID=UPI0028DBB767|nr:endonuclease III [uncultured Bifidobacterium sp.]